MVTVDNNVVAAPKFLTADELAATLRIHPKTVGRRVAAGILPKPDVIAKPRLWRWESVETWMKLRRRKR